MCLHVRSCAERPCGIWTAHARLCLTFLGLHNDLAKVNNSMQPSHVSHRPYCFFVWFLCSHFSAALITCCKNTPVNLAAAQTTVPQVTREKLSYAVHLVYCSSVNNHWGPIAKSLVCVLVSRA